MGAHFLVQRENCWNVLQFLNNYKWEIPESMEYYTKKVQIKKTTVHKLHSISQVDLNKALSQSIMLPSLPDGGNRECMSIIMYYYVYWH